MRTSLARTTILTSTTALLLLGLGLAPGDASAQTRGEPGYEIVYLLTDCAAAGHGPGECVETLADLNTLIWDPTTGLNPTASEPLIVDMGPGKFPGAIGCPVGGGQVTFRGAGRDRTILTGPSSPTFLMAKVTVVVFGCESLGFHDMRIESSDIGIYWVLAGSSSWTDVDVAATNYGWYDALCNGDATDPPAGVHYFYGSKVEAQQVGFFGNCGETWFYGSELLARPQGAVGTPIGLQVSGRADVRVFGSAVRVVTADATSGSGGLAAGVNVGVGPGGYDPGGTFHMHGGIISVDASTISGMNARGLFVHSGLGQPSAHTPDTAFALRPGPGGEAIRLDGTGTIRSPFLWPAGDAPPLGPLGSQTGKDLYVETDCDAVDCTGGADSHLMIYQESCVGTSGTPWFDVVTGACRVP
jgi:hypothetical protein